MENWERGKQNPTTSMEEFKWWQKGGAKPKDIFEKRCWGLEEAFDFVIYEIFPSAKSKS